MKQADIDKKIGMPDVDAEWAKFEREVIGKPTASRKPLYWGIGIAASIALVAGIVLFGHYTEEILPQLAESAVAEQAAQPLPAPVGERLVVGTETSMPSQSEELQTPPPTPPLEGRGVAAPSVAPSASQHSTRPELLAQATPPTAEETVYDCGESMPKYPGGGRALKEFINNNLRYPDLAMEYGASGRVMMSFLVDSCGYVSDIKPIKYLIKYDTLYMNRLPAEWQLALKEQIKSLVGEECTRILSLMPQRWAPANQFGKFVSARVAVPIIFNATDAEREAYLAQRKVTNEELQGRIAGLGIPDSVRQARRDSILRQREINMDSMLIVVNGTPIPAYKFNRKGVAPYLYKQHQLLSDSDVNVEERIGRAVYQPYGGSEEERKRRCFETYGNRAKYGVIEVTTIPDTYCDDYVSKHPELKKERHHIEGYVYDVDDKALADAWVSIRGKGIGAATDSTGHFSIWLPQTDVELMASHIGYVPCVVKTTQPMLTIQLRSATKLREVKVTPKQP